MASATKLQDRPVVVFLSGVVAAFVAGFFAYEILEDRINSKVENAVKAAVSPKSERDSRTGCIRIDDVQLCWGQADVTPNTVQPKARHAIGTFALSFASPPTLTMSALPHEKSAATTFSPYAGDVTNTDFNAEFFASSPDPSEEDTVAVRVSYLAVGTWK